MDLSDIKKVSFGGYDRHDVEDYIEALHTKYNTLYQNANSQIEFFTEKTNNLEQEIDNCRSQYNELITQKDKLQVLVEQEYKRIQDINKINNSLIEENNQFKKLNITIETYKSLQDRNDELELAVEELKRRGHDVNQAELQQLRFENRNYSTVIEDLKKNVNDATQNEVDNLRERNKIQSSQIEEFKKLLENPPPETQVLADVKNKVTIFLQKAKEKENEIILEATKRSEQIVKEAREHGMRIKQQMADEAESMVDDTRYKIRQMSSEAAEQADLSVKITNEQCESIVITTKAQIEAILQTAKHKSENIVDILKTRNHTLQLEKEALMRQSEDVVRKVTITGQSVGINLNEKAVKKQRDTAEYFDEISALKNSINSSLNELKASLEIMDGIDTDF